MKQCAIVIPVYKVELNPVEIISLKRLNTVIGDKGYDVFLVCPKGLDIKNYTNLYKGLKKKEFDPKYFESTATYSQMCISYDFYNTFSKYEYMLIHQLDCYLFSDEIKEWCGKGYDYIGGPIFSQESGWDRMKVEMTHNNWHPFIGNGGFSLRKIETFKYLTDPDGEFRKMFALTDDKLKNVIYEDKYFCHDLYDFYDLNVPNWPDAIEFCLDMSVDMLYDYLHMNPTPMGVHAVEKNIRFWKDRIEEFKDPEIIQYCEDKYKDFFSVYYNAENKTYRV